MGVFDSVMVPCPKCGETNEFQSKSGDCTLAVYSLEEAPEDVMANVNRHAPITCWRCKTRYFVNLLTREVKEAGE